MLGELLYAPPRCVCAVVATVVLAAVPAQARQENGSNRLSGPGAPDVDAFAASLAESVEASKTIGVLPLAFFPEGGEPFVTRLGVELGTELATAIESAGFGGVVLNPREMIQTLRDLNVTEPTALYRYADVLAQGPRLGVDVVVFGTMSQPDVAGRADPIEVEVIAADVLERFEVGSSCAFAIPGTKQHKRAIDLLVPDRAWTVAERLPASGRGDLLHELRVAVVLLSKRIEQHPCSQPKEEERRIYVAPADSSLFASGFNELSSLWDEYRRNKLALDARPIRPDGSNPRDEPFSLGGYEFPNVDAARAFLTAYRKSLQSTDNYRFCTDVARQVVEELRPRLDPSEVFNDLTFLQSANPEELDDLLTSGGAVNDRTVQAQLRRAGITMVVQPRFLRLGEYFLLRADVYDLEERDFALSTSFALDGRYSKALAEKLEVLDPGGGVSESLVPLDRASRQEDWAGTCERVESGVFWLQGESEAGIATGTGFLVDAAGLVMTNAHVVEALATGTRWAVVLHDGSLVPLDKLDVVQSDPFLDVAILRVANLPKELHVFELAGTERARRGVEVAVLGHPKGTVAQVFTPGHLSSTEELVYTGGETRRPSYMYTCLTRSGSSGSPVLLRDGLVIAVNSHGTRGDVTAVDADGNTAAVSSDIGVVSGELPGFALGARSTDAAGILERMRSE